MQGKPQYQEPKYSAPYRGWNTQAPENMIPPSDTPFSQNWMYRNAEMRTFPRFLTKPIPYLGEQNPCLGLTSFLDSNNVTHTIALTANNLWQLVNSQLKDPSVNPYLWNLVASFNTVGTRTPYALQTFINQVFWTTGDFPGVFYWDGISAFAKEATTGKFGGYFLGELGFHLILLNTIEVEAESNVSHPQRVRWCVSGLPTIWDPAVNPDAGDNDMFDVPDAITGFMPVGQVGFIFRANGITQMSLTGQAGRPFTWNHLWAADRGIGNVYPFSVANYGSVGIFISTEDIYKITLYSFEPIGGTARDQIISDLSDAQANPIATMTHGYSNKFIYMTYHLFIPTLTGCIVWIYSVEDKNWMRRIIDTGYPTARMRIVATT